MKKIKLIMIGLGMVCASQSIGQTYAQDALRFSQTSWLSGSTARMQGLAGAQVSLGGDPSLAATNPAGLGFFNRSAASFSLGLGFQDSDDEFAGLTSANFNNTFNVNNAAVVLNYNKGRFTEEKFKGGSLGISVSRINDFNREFSYEGESGASLLDPVLENLRFGTGGELEDAFFQQFLVDEFFFDDNTTPAFNENGGIISPNQTGAFVDWGSPIVTIPYQQEQVSERGGQYQFNVSWGGNYDDKLYFGGGLGIQSIYYNRQRTYIESEFIDENQNLDPYLNSIVLEDNLVARGGGINATVGVIVRPVQQITLGVSYQSPTYLTINEESDFILSTDWENFSYEDLNGNGDIINLQSDLDSYLSTINEFQYNLKTPARLNAGASIFLGKLGFLTGDVEMVDYGNAELRSNDGSLFNDNQLILNDFNSVLNYRVGAEFRLDNILFRGGYGVNQDPTPAENDQTNLTFGVGYKTQDFFIDLAAVNTQFKTGYAPFQFGTFDTNVRSDINNTMITVTAGFSF